MANSTSSLARRDMLRLGLASCIGVSSSGWLPALAQQIANDGRRRRQCILLWMSGGPSQLDTFDMKPGQATGGEFKEMATAVPGLRFSEHLPKLAPQADQLAIVRGVNTREGDHQRGTYLMRTGQRPGTPTQYPCIGSALAKSLSEPQASLPEYFSINPVTQISPEAFGPGFLGPKYAAATVGANGGEGPPPPNGDTSEGYAELRVDNLTLPREIAAEQAQARIALWRSLQQPFLAERGAPGPVAQDTVYQRALNMMHSPDIAAFDLSKEPDAVRQAYGRGRFGQGCLLARRLIERGVPIVEVTLGNGLGWDTHQDNFNVVKRLSQELDQGWGTLMAELRDRGLLDSTTVLWMGEFGRTPQINPMGGRDHFPDAWSCVFAGGGIRGGQAYGATSANGMEVVDGKVTQSDLLATLCVALGVDPETENVSPQGRPHKITEGCRFARSSATSRRKQRMKCRMGHSWVRAGFLLSIVMIGCTRQTPGPSRTAPSPAPAPPASSVAKPPLAKTAETQPTKVTSPTITATEASDAAAQEAPPDSPLAAALVPTPPAIPSERLMLLVEGSPLLVDLQLTVNGYPYRQGLDKLVDEVLKQADSDQNGQVTWQEMTTSPRLIHGQYGGPRITSEEQRRQIVYGLDTNRNDRVDADEASAFLHPEQRSVQALIIDSEPIPAADARTEPVFAWLDENADARLSKQEIDQAEARLWLRDTDGNGRLILSEFPQATSADTTPNARQASRSAIWLNAVTDWTAVLFRIEERYAFGNPLQPSDLQGPVDRFAQLDVNADGSWDTKEVGRLAEVEADLVVRVPLGEPAEPLRTSSTDEQMNASDERSIDLDWAGQPLRIERIADVSQEDPASRIAEAWPQLDANRDGSLDRTEYSMAEAVTQLPFVAVDDNGDQQVAQAELEQAVRRRFAAQRVRVQLRFAPVADSLFDQLDANRDEQLTERELRRATTRLAELSESDGVLLRANLPLRALLTLRQGIGQGIQIPVPTSDRVATEPPEAPDSAPVWFVQMDGNRDGDISWREFLGSHERFTQLDQDGDGFVTAHEAVASH